MSKNDMQLLVEYMDGQFIKLAESLSPTIDKVSTMHEQFTGFDATKVQLATIESVLKATNQEIRGLRTMPSDIKGLTASFQSIDKTLGNLAHQVDIIEKQQFVDRDLFTQIRTNIKRTQQQLKAHATHA